MAGRKSTTQLLATLRQLMQDVKHVGEPLQAYVVPWADAHNSEYLAECDQQRAFLSGFTGSAGTAVVTQSDARLWTDGRYYLQASQELDANWTLMKESLPDTPSQGAWLCKALPAGSRVGADPLVMAHSAWRPLHEQLRAAGHALVPVKENLVDLMWTDRPARPARPVRSLAVEYAGRSTADKLADVRRAMKDGGATALVVTALDEVAWLLNLRGSDIAFCPVFFAYAIVTGASVELLTDAARVEPRALELVRAECGGGAQFSVRPYGEAAARVAKLADEGGRVWMAASAPHALAGSLPERALLAQATPVALAKAVKNAAEASGMRAAHERDGAALCRFFAWLEREVAQGARVTETSAAARLERFRAEQRDYMGPSFETISSSGAHGAIIHHRPTLETDAEISREHLYLCDSGGQYLDGTTDVTRTVHHGEPTAHERECFTRVLQGQLALAAAVFPERIKGNCLDSFARRALWQAGLDYQHGTGHGIGHYLNVHEGPMGISWRSYPEDPGLQAGMFLSNEPGYYEDGRFGIRLENIVQVVHAQTPHRHEGRTFLTFDTITMCPIQTKMIARELLSEGELRALNAYHETVRARLSPLLAEHRDALAWLERETRAL